VLALIRTFCPEDPYQWCPASVVPLMTLRILEIELPLIISGVLKVPSQSSFPGKKNFPSFHLATLSLTGIAPIIVFFRPWAQRDVRDDF
jgi:hypothetical protein